MKNINACLSHNSDDWMTPKEIYCPLMKMGFNDCFPFQSHEDEFLKDYHHQKLFINPPFSKLGLVADWVIRQLNNRNIVVLLIPSRTDTKYFHKLLDTKPLIFLFKGRLKFNDSNSAPFPSLCLMWNTIPIVDMHFPFYMYGDIKKFLKDVRDLWI